MKYYNYSKEKGLINIGARENKFQKLQNSQNEMLRMTILPECAFSIHVKLDIYFLGLP